MQKKVSITECSIISDLLHNIKTFSFIVDMAYREEKSIFRTPL